MYLNTKVTIITEQPVTKLIALFCTGFEQCIGQSWDYEVNDNNRNKISNFYFSMRLV